MAKAYTTEKIADADGLFFGVRVDGTATALLSSLPDAEMFIEAHQMRDKLASLESHQPINDQVIVKQHKRGAVYKGIILPDKARDKLWCGTVVAMGPGKLRDDGTRVPPQVKVGDVVYFHWDNNRIEINGEEYLSMKQDTILAVLE